MAKRGRPRKFETPEDFRRAVEAYFAECEEKGNVFPDLAGMRLFLDVAERTISKWQESDSEEAEEYREIMAWTKDKRESWLARRSACDNKVAQGCMNLLKQPCNGGYIDRPVENTEKTLTINLVGVGGKTAFE